MNSPIINTKLLSEAYQAGRQQALNEQGMMSNNFNTNASRFPQTGGGLVGGSNQSPSMMSNNFNTNASRSPRRSGREFSPSFPGTDQELQSHIDTLFSLWGTLPADLPDWMYMYDFNGDGVIDGTDLGILLGQQGITA